MLSIRWVPSATCPKLKTIATVTMPTAPVSTRAMNQPWSSACFWSRMKPPRHVNRAMAAIMNIPEPAASQ